MRTRVLVIVLLCATWVSAQSLEERYRTFSQAAEENYSDFREAANKRYAEFIREAWEYYGAKSALPMPKEQLLPPVEYKEEEEEGTLMEELTPESTLGALVYEEEASSEVAPLPEPIAPIEETQTKNEICSINYFGTQFSFRYPAHIHVSLANLDESTLADEWVKLSKTSFNNLIRDCILVRNVYQLCDWGYLQMLQLLSEAICGKTNEAVLLQAYIYAQSGYAMRLAKKDNRLFLLLGSNYQFYNVRYFELDNMFFYTSDSLIDDGFYICKGKFDSEHPLDLRISQEQNLESHTKRTRPRTSSMSITASCEVNTNQIDFYNSYPTGILGTDIGSRWAIYANAPVEENVRKTLYPTLQQAIEGKTQKQAVKILLNWVQTAFPYQKDENVWGYDRAFFPSETMYYPYSDCEDRSILLSRVIRDLLGLDVLLLYFPGHLATAVCLDEEAKGYYLTYNNRKYMVCDPTYLGAPIGKLQPGLDTKSLKVIPL